MQRKEKMDTLIDKFEEFWQAYPQRNGKRLGKQATLTIFTHKQLHSEQFQELLMATKNYANSKMARTGYAKDPERFLRNGYWQDWIEPETTPEDIAKQEIEHERLKRELKMAYQDRQAAQNFLDSCPPDDVRYEELNKRVRILNKKIEALERSVR